MSANNASQSGSNGRQLNLIVVDDDHDNARGLALMLRLCGHEVRTAFTGEEALAAVAASPPDAVLLDLAMPGMDGYEVAERLREHNGGRNTILLAVSGYGSEHEVQRTKAAGFTHHFLKPVDIKLLLEVLKLV